MKQRPRLSTVCIQFLALVFGLLSIRWFLFEPFTVPSGSMFPNLLVNDYILVNKMKPGLKIPYTDTWLIGPYLPERGQIVVFRSVRSDAYFVKRLMGLPGDIIKMKQHQILEINGQKVSTESAPEVWQNIKKYFPYEDSKNVTAFYENYEFFENTKPKKITLMYTPTSEESKVTTYEVPKDQLFFVGDHRSSSSDGRVWGFVETKHLVGPLSKILFSCQSKNASTQFCDPQTIRWDRVFTSPNSQTYP